MKSPEQFFGSLKGALKKEWKIAFMSAALLGLLIHMPILLSDIPNHDGLDSMYFDQNMITSGRWFLTVACGFSSYFTIPWIIGLLGILFLGCTAAALTELLQIKKPVVIWLVSALLVSFPALASTFAYVFTLDGYMLALLLAVLAVLFTQKKRFGFLPGAVCLAFSMGTYQAYLPFAILLCMYAILLFIMGDGESGGKGRSLKEVWQNILHYLLMGGLGMFLYFVILQILLKVQGKELAGYQGISNLESGVVKGAGSSLVETLGSMYRDFFAFTLKGNIFVGNVFGAVGLIALTAVFAYVVIGQCMRNGWWKKIGFFVLLVLLAAGIPLATNAIQLISPDLNYHLLMRYQWVLYPMIMLSFVERFGGKLKGSAFVEWVALCACLIVSFRYAVADNIAYSNLEKKYEKTYAYCLRLLDRIEQTPGYYQGIPIAMVGVVGDEQFPMTDITGKVTAGMIGMEGDSLLYTGENYEAFMKHYLGATLNFLEADAMADIYYSEEYMEMESFPGKTSTKVVGGVMYVKTENVNR